MQMKKSGKLKWCNWSLLVAAVMVIASSIQLEATGSRGLWPVWLHLGVAVVFAALAGYHVYLHFNRSNWFAKFAEIRSRQTRILWWVSVAAVGTGLIALCHWSGDFTHSHIGAIHGKIGFLMLFLAIGHTVKRFGFFRK